MGKTTKTLAKEKVLAALEELPEEKVKELLDFIESLLLKEKAKKSEPILDPDKDPILKLIGLADVEPFADKIDDALYGKR
jgi:hypothetical protein